MGPNTSVKDPIDFLGGSISRGDGGAGTGGISAGPSTWNGPRKKLVNSPGLGRSGAGVLGVSTGKLRTGKSGRVGGAGMLNFDSCLGGGDSEIPSSQAGAARSPDGSSSAPRFGIAGAGLLNFGSRVCGTGTAGAAAFQSGAARSPDGFSSAPRFGRGSETGFGSLAGMLDPLGDGCDSNSRKTWVN